MARRRRFDGVTFALRSYSVLVFIFLYLPILFVIIYSFNKGRRLLIWNGFGTNWYGSALDNPGIRSALSTSIRVAILSALVAVVLGTLAGVALARRGGRWSTPFTMLVFLILVTPEIVDGIAYLIWFARIDEVFNLDLRVSRLVIGHSIFNSAVVTLIVRARLQGLDESLEEAAADLGANPTRAFRQITLPLMLPAILAGGLLAFTFSLDDVIISAFVSKPGSFTLPVYIFSALRTGLRPELAAISTMMLGLTLVAIAIAAMVLRRSGESAGEVTATLTGA
jgi:ABC-type spermidine/putrescine transport system permease subunit II